MFEHSAILAFHQTSGRFYPGINNIRPADFFSIVNMLERGGFRFYEGKGGSLNASNGKPKIVFSFDDGYEDNFDILVGLRDRSITPVVFIPTDHIGKRNGWDYSSRFFSARHLNAGQIRRLAEYGVIIGSHGASHRCLTGMATDSLMEELSRSKKQLEDIIGFSVNLISFPFGRTNDRVNGLAQECGYEHGFTLGAARIQIGRKRFLFPRLAIYGIDDYFSLKAKLSLKPTAAGRFERLKNNVINRLAGGTIIVSPRLK
jgi:peptidoglycan/xylan/chitin deacetylase (PgdA/CDA1 family)